METLNHGSNSASLLRSSLVGNNSYSQSNDSQLAARPKQFTNGQEMMEDLEKLGETLGDFKAYDSQLSIAEVKHTRIVKCLYKATKDSKTGELVESKNANSYVRIPTKHLTEEHIIAEIKNLAPHVLTWLQSLEDGMIKDAHKAGQLKIYPQTLSLGKLIEKLEEENTSARLTKEKIEAWFDEVILEVLSVKFADKMGLNESSSDEELNKLEAILNAYKAKFSSLAGGKTFIKEADCLAMIGVIKNCEADETALGSRFIARLEGMNKKEEDLLLAL